jgi:hypothetical protein
LLPHPDLGLRTTEAHVPALVQAREWKIVV